MRETYDKYYTVEMFTDKEVFEVVATCESVSEAVGAFIETLIKNPDRQVRMYSPNGNYDNAVFPTLPIELMYG